MGDGAAPAGFHTVTPYLVIKGVDEALDWYGRAFEAVRGRCLRTPNGLVAYSEIRIGDSMVMVCDETPMFQTRGPTAYGGSPVSIQLYVADADSLYSRALSLGAKSVKAPEDQFHGDRSGSIEDPFGYSWILATRIEEVSDDELERRWQVMAAQMPSS